MAPSVSRRHTPAKYAKELIAAIIAIRQQKQIPNFERISRYLQRNIDITPRKIKEHLNNAVSDGLIVEYTAIGFKGQRTGLEQEGYRVPQTGEVDVVNDGHDWYCSECHSPGEVFECCECFRVYHQGCTKEDTSGETFTCSICRDNEAGRKKNKMKRKMLNTLLSYTVLRLREKTKELHKISTKLNADDFKRFVYRKMDLNRMEQKVQSSRYKCLEEFLADAKVILHNCTLVFGDDMNGMAGLASIMVKDCKYEIDEIELCPNCYYMSNAKPEDWFSQPCNPPHDIVFAKQKGYSYWPAKVVRDLGGKFDVRFFGGWHQRAVIPAEYIKPITTDLKSMAIKKTSGFSKAMKELARYQEILEEREQSAEANGERPESEEEEEIDNEEEVEEEDSNYEDNIEDVDDEEMKDSKSEEMDEKGNSSLAEEEHIKKRPFKKTPKRRESSLSQSQSKKTPKRFKYSAEDEDNSDFKQEDEFDNRQVTSTSVDRSANTKKRKSSKSTSHDESYTVTSSVDKVSNINLAVTVSVACQTTSLKTETESVHTQTDGISTELLEDKIGLSRLSSSPHQSDDTILEERMSSAMASLTKRLEEKFEEDKALALKQQSQQLEEDFGKDKQQAVERTIATMKLEVEKARKQGEDKAKEQYMEEMKKLAAKHKDTISQTKKKQWCQYCEEEAMYHCCWNTSYCSIKCQQEHWHKEHKRFCRRKRNETNSKNDSDCKNETTRK
ncbi:zinc finger MYND domain-containing protein 11-like isoform X1 [Biomphalaria glabrata]|nr:zinc finger MYND domain-containing protein 11-like isoform X1 [Biomphalaria glabrata]